jgi:hypothetical protein
MYRRPREGTCASASCQLRRGRDCGEAVIRIFVIDGESGFPSGCCCGRFWVQSDSEVVPLAEREVDVPLMPSSRARQRPTS